jgi:hypothetical protein
MLIKRVSRKTKVRLAYYVALSLVLAAFVGFVGGALAKEVPCDPQQEAQVESTDPFTNGFPDPGANEVEPPSTQNKELRCHDGTGGPDKLVGSNDPQVIDDMRGYGGNDELRGLGGFDALLGGNGADTLIGGAGNDAIYAAGNTFGFPPSDQATDRIYGGGGDDTVFARYKGGGGLPDIISCGPGEDRYDVSQGDDVAKDCEIKFKEDSDRHWASQWLGPRKKRGGK